MAELLTALSYVGLTALLGTVLARRWLTPGRPGLGPGLAGLALLLLAWGGQVAVTLGALGLTGADDVLAYITTTATGRAMLTGLLGATLLLATEVAAWPAVLAAVTAGVTLWGVAGIGHGEGHGPLVRALHAVHAGAMGVWVGGVLALAVTRRPTPDLARRFTPAALGSVVLLALTGLLMATEHLTALSEWLNTSYGRTLLLKLALVAVALLAAILVRRAFAQSARALVPLTREALALLAVLGVTAVLSNTAPPGGHSEHAQAGEPDAAVHATDAHGAPLPDLCGVTLCVDPQASGLEFDGVAAERVQRARAALTPALGRLLDTALPASTTVIRRASCDGQEGHTQLTVSVRSLDPQHYVGYGGAAYSCTVRLRVVPTSPGGHAFAADWSAIHSEQRSGQSFEAAVVSHSRDAVEALIQGWRQDNPGGS